MKHRKIYDWQTVGIAGKAIADYNDDDFIKHTVTCLSLDTDYFLLYLFLIKDESSRNCVTNNNAQNRVSKQKCLE